MKKKWIRSQSKLIELLKTGEWIIRLPIKDRRGPFIFPTAKGPVGNSIQIYESMFHKMRKKGSIKLVRQVRDSDYVFDEYGLPYKTRKIRIRRRKGRRKKK